jgi:hypothetical protein
MIQLREEYGISIMPAITNIAWFFKEGMADYASSFYVAYKEYISYSQDSTLRNYSFEKLYDSLWSGNFKYDINDSIVLNTELLLTGTIFSLYKKSFPGEQPT